MIYLRNKQTGEVKSVVPQGAEFLALKKFVDPAGRPLWEQTGAHHATDVVARAEVGALKESDLGERDKPLADTVNERKYAADVAPHLNLTDAEREMGLTPESKAEEHASMFTQGGQETLETASEAIASGSDSPDPETTDPSLTPLADTVDPGDSDSVDDAVDKALAGDTVSAESDKPETSAQKKKREAADKAAADKAQA